MKKEITENRYIKSIHAVQDYVEKHLTEDLSLDTLAKVSCFSKFHFHRLFRALMGETVLNYINRTRLERATNCLLQRGSRSITDIALDFGYTDPAVFARSFKKHYGITASEARNDFRNNGLVNSKIGKAMVHNERYLRDIARTQGKDYAMLLTKPVEITTVNPIYAMYLRHIGTYEELAQKFDGMIQILISFGMNNSLITPSTFKLFAVYHDNPEYTNEEQLKTSICLAIPKDTSVPEEFGILEIPKGKYAIGSFAVKTPEEARKTWDYMYGQWLPNSGLLPGDGPVFEIYMNDPSTHPDNLHLIDIYLPIS